MGRMANGKLGNYHISTYCAMLFGYYIRLPLLFLSLQVAATRLYLFVCLLLKPENGKRRKNKHNY